jgi:heme-degrading monooxygenase HmoA
MHARVALYRLTSGTVEDVARKAEEGMLPIFRDQPGFVSYRLVRGEDETIISISRWQSRDQADRATEAAASWVRDNIADNVALQQNYVGEVVLSSD